MTYWIRFKCSLKCFAMRLASSRFIYQVQYGNHMRYHLDYFFSAWNSFTILRTTKELWFCSNHFRLHFSIRCRSFHPQPVPCIGKKYFLPNKRVQFIQMRNIKIEIECLLSDRCISLPCVISFYIVDLIRHYFLWNFRTVMSFDLQC